VLGIRLRRPSGFKFSVKGGREGLFIPSGSGGVGPGQPLLVCEGPTDTAALLDLGFEGVVGRPSCTGGVRLLTELVKRRQRPEVVIVADGDEPGRRGAAHLASVLLGYAPAVRVISPPAGVKDARAWRQSGCTREEVDRAIRAAPVQRLVICARERHAQGGE
jgi:DNA primase